MVLIGVSSFVFLRVIRAKRTIHGPSSGQEPTTPKEGATAHMTAEKQFEDGLTS
jgi:hypothetical protein